MSGTRGRGSPGGGVEEGPADGGATGRGRREYGSGPTGFKNPPSAMRGRVRGPPVGGSTPPHVGGDPGGPDAANILGSNVAAFCVMSGIV